MRCRRRRLQDDTLTIRRRQAPRQGVLRTEPDCTWPFGVRREFGRPRSAVNTLWREKRSQDGATCSGLVVTTLVRSVFQDPRSEGVVKSRSSDPGRSVREGVG